MHIEAVRVTGYRPFRDGRLTLEGVSALIGPNGSGKSSLLGALRLFFDPRLAVDERDFWAAPDGRSSDELAVEVSFGGLTGEAKKGFGPFVREGRLAIERHFDGPGRGVYLAYRPGIKEFDGIRTLPKGHRDAFNALADSGTIPGLHRAGSRDEAFSMMAQWELEHPELCSLMAVPVDFIEAPAGEPTAIATYLRFFFIGAMEDPATHLEAGSGGAISDLIREAVDTSALENRLQQIAEDANDKGRAAVEASSDVFAGLHASTDEMLKRFAPGYSLDLAWAGLTDLRAARPSIRASVRATDGVETELAYQGQGVQRSLMYAVLTAQAAEARPDNSRTIVLAIEEPEAFQHPLSSQVLSRTLRTLPDNGYQIVYTTHSSHFLNASVITGVRLINREISADGPSSTISAFDLDALISDLEAATGRDDFTVDSTTARLEANLEPAVLEGLFGRVCVLVEGDEDEALIAAACRTAGVDLSENGIALVKTRGKAAMPLKLAFLRRAGIDCYPIFDLDRNGDDPDRASEKALMRLVGIESDLDLSGDQIGDRFACWDTDLGATVRREAGDDFVELLTAVCHELGYRKQQGQKVAPVLNEVMTRASAAGLTSPSLDALVRRLGVLTGQSQEE